MLNYMSWFADSKNTKSGKVGTMGKRPFFFLAAEYEIRKRWPAFFNTTTLSPKYTWATFLILFYGGLNFHVNGVRVNV